MERETKSNNLSGEVDIGRKKKEKKKKKVFQLLPLYPGTIPFFVPTPTPLCLVESCLEDVSGKYQTLLVHVLHCSHLFPESLRAATVVKDGRPDPLVSPVHPSRKLLPLLLFQLLLPAMVLLSLLHLSFLVRQRPPEGQPTARTSECFDAVVDLVP